MRSKTGTLAEVAVRLLVLLVLFLAGCADAGPACPPDRVVAWALPDTGAAVALVVVYDSVTCDAQRCGVIVDRSALWLGDQVPIQLCRATVDH